MGTRQWIAGSRYPRLGTPVRRRSLDSYGTVLMLTILDYLAVSTLTSRAWGRVIIAVLLGVTLLFTLRTSGARRIWITLAVIFLVASTLLTLVGISVPGASDVSQATSLAGGLLLVVTPLAIARRISAHRVVTTETVLGAISVYLLLGFSFAYIYSAIGSLGTVPFFTDHSHATINDYLFFSYTTLTTVGYGNLVPAGTVGQTFAMLEALTGQIYLVIVVARLVSLWGQERSNSNTRSGSGTAANDATSSKREGISVDKDLRGSVE